MGQAPWLLLHLTTHHEVLSSGLHMAPRFSEPCGPCCCERAQLASPTTSPGLREEPSLSFPVMLGPVTSTFLTASPSSASSGSRVHRRPWGVQTYIAHLLWRVLSSGASAPSSTIYHGTFHVVWASISCSIKEKKLPNPDMQLQDEPSFRDANGWKHVLLSTDKTQGLPTFENGAISH